jgi:hypothetical protein
VRVHDRQTARPAAGIPGAELAVGHHARVAQPHTTAEGPIADAEVVAAGIRSKEYPLGSRGLPWMEVRRSSPGWAAPRASRSPLGW